MSEDQAPATITDLKIISNVYKFEWNFAEVKQTIEGNIQKYVGLVVTEDNLKDMEAAQKEIASIRTKIDGFRKAVKKKMEEPYKVFEGEIKELLQLIEKAESPLKNQTLQYELDRVAAKEKELGDFAAKTAVNMGVRNNYFNFAVKSQWTNRTAKDPAVRKEIVTAIETMLDAQRRNDEAEEMKRQKIEMIESVCSVHSIGFSLKTPVTPNDIAHLIADAVLGAIPGIILAECQKRAAMERKAAEPKVVDVPPQPDHVHHSDDNSIGFPNYGGECDMSYEEDCIMPPLPPAPRVMPPTPPNYSPIKPQLFNCVIEYPNITVQEAITIKKFLSDHAISFNIISQTAVGGEF